MSKITRMLSTLLVVLAMSMPVAAEWVLSTNKFMAGDAGSGDNLGEVSMGISGTDYYGDIAAIDGNVVLVGAVRDDEAAGDAGAVYVCTGPAPTATLMIVR